jgi:hypothetical protein
MTAASSRGVLTETLLSLQAPEEVIQDHVHRIHQDVLAQSRILGEADFSAIHPRDLAWLFGAYDQRFFSGLLQRTLEGRRLDFRLSSRMTVAGGKTTRFTSRVTGEISYEIVVGSSMLFEGFGMVNREINVCGLPCENRLQALQRIVEHEIVHLAEQLCWESSDCAAARFQDIAGRLFLHRAHTHQLVTRRERAAALGVHVGSRVSFLFEGRALTGRVNRITKRATVLVEDSTGLPYSDGARYKTYYVPNTLLETVGE